MGKTRLVLVMALMCMAVACHEAHLDASSTKAFDDSLMTMYRDHSIEEAKAFGAHLMTAQELLGKDVVRSALNGTNWAEANAYLDQVLAKNAPPNSPDPVKG